MKFVKDHQHSMEVGTCVYVMDTDKENHHFKLNNRVFSFEVGVSEFQYGINGAMYFSEVATDGGLGP